MTNNLEVGLRAEQRIQRTSFENQNNGNGFGMGYYLRYNFTQFDPIRLVLKKSPFNTTFFIEWEHLLANYSYARQIDIESYLSQPRYMIRESRFNQHHYVPKIGLKTGIYRKLFFILNLTYTSVNFEKIENPFLGRIAIEYTF